MIVAGTVTLKMAPVLKRIWDQMPDPKWCISMGACSSVGGPFNTYAVLQGVDLIVPVDVYVTGCPPRPENLFYALLKLQDKIDQMTTLVKRPTEVRLDESMRGSVVAVETAGCIPTLLVGRRRRGVAAVQAGCRATAARIAMRAVEAMGARFGSMPADLRAAIGPGIGPCCYEVGPEVMKQF